MKIQFSLFYFTLALSFGEAQEIKRILPAPDGLSFPDQPLEAIHQELEAYVDRLWEISDNPYSGDVEALVKAVDLALEFNEFYDEKHFALVDKWLAIAKERYLELEEKRTHSWSKETGLVVRGYRSSIDDSCQPYGLEVSPELDLSKPVPLVVWLHGRSDQTTDLHFLEACSQKSQVFGGLLGEQNEAIILHPFGRHCVGWKHAGEIDVIEAIEAVRRDFPIDPQRIVLAGFSMGGAGAWHIGAHYRDKFCAVTAGAGFAETARYNKLTPENYPPENEQILWSLYDVPNYRRNFLNGPLLSYSGEKDKQKASADLMEEELRSEGHNLLRVIGKDVEHRYTKESVAEIWEWIRQTWVTGNIPQPESLYFQTRTLRYPSFKWIRLTGLEKHWQDTRADGQWNQEGKTVTLEMKNVTSFEVQSPAGTDLGDYTLVINGQRLKSESPGFPVISLSIQQKLDQWSWGEASGLRKKPGIQGPIDDAFMSRFVVVSPKFEEIRSPALKKWVEFEVNHFRTRWKALMRGKLIEESSSRLDRGDIEKANLILWGDPASNPLLAEILPQLPLQWDGDSFTFQGKTYPTNEAVPVFIFPNPLNPDRYVVINSGLTFREDHDRTNSQQNPKLPDWAVIGFDLPPSGSSPGRIIDTGFFDENWK